MDLPNETDLSNIPLSDWMGQSPWFLQLRPLVNLCIPGSHDSFTSGLDRRGPIANDEPKWLQILANLFPFIKRVVYNWSMCQKLPLSQQLQNGVRYLDIRLARQNSDLCTVHGLCGMDLDSLLADVDSFLQLHPKEVILLDVNHFYDMQWPDHRHALVRLLSVFGSRCCPSPPFVDVTSINLATCWQRGWCVIVFYQIPFHLLENVLSTIADVQRPSVVNYPTPFMFWTSQFIKSPWSNTDKIDPMIKYNECALAHKGSVLPCGGFFVTQGVLTPRNRDILLRPFSTLCDRMGVPAAKAIVDWLIKRCHTIQTNLNVVIIDFVETSNFCRTVIMLNA